MLVAVSKAGKATVCQAAPGGKTASVQLLDRMQGGCCVRCEAKPSMPFL